MEYHLKRAFQLEDLVQSVDPSGNVSKKRKTEKGDEEVNNCQRDLPMISVQDDDKSAAKEKKKSAEMRLEVNRQRAREIRKRKKIMIENMQNQLVLLTMENNKLRMESQNQQQELIVLRKTSELLASNHRPPTQTSAPPRLSNSDILNMMSGGGGSNTHDRLSDLLLASAHSGNFGGSDAFLHSNTLPPSRGDLGRQTLQNHAYPFGS